MRLLPVRPDHDRGRAAGEEDQAHAMPISTKPCAATSAAAGPMRHIRRAIHRAAEIEGAGRQGMTPITNVNRRDFFKTTAAGAGGLMLGFALPGKSKLSAQFRGAPRGSDQA